MPKGVVKTKKQETIWEAKKREVSKQTGKKISQFSDDEWRRVNFLYQKAKKKYKKGKLPKKYTKASFIESVTARYHVITASAELEYLHDILLKAKNQIDLLCNSFDVKLVPSYDEVINKVIKKVDYWEKTDKLAGILEKIPIIYFDYKPTRSILSAVEELPPVLFKQFHDKFLHIVTTLVVPALKVYMKQNPSLNVKVFKPLLNVAIK